MIRSLKETIMTSVRIPFICSAACFVSAGYGTSIVAGVLSNEDES